MKKAIVFLLIVTIILLVAACDMVNLTGGTGGEGDGTVSWAGIRFSSYGMRQSYGKDYFPNETKTTSLVKKMSSYYDDSAGTVILIVGPISSNKDKSGNVVSGNCSLEFPLSKEIEYAYGDDEDAYDSYLTAFDKAGYSVWLQVEPGDADLVELATEVMSHYGPKHKCVKGFGIDVEWYKYRYDKAKDRETSSKLTDDVARKVVQAVRKINSNYTVFVKHWDERWLPSSYRDGLIFVSDSQIYESIDAMRDDFAGWAAHYAPNPVMFQIGYNADKWFWSELDNPAKDLGSYIAEGCTSGNKLGIIWVDFTLKEVLN